MNLEKGKEYVIVIDEQTGVDGTDTVFISVNGKAYQIVRGYEVVVPYEVIKVLEDAVYKKYKYDDNGNVKEYKVPRFNYRVIKEASAKDKIKNKVKIER